MVEALRSGQIGHAGLDVFERRAAAAGPCADDARQRHAVGALRAFARPEANQRLIEAAFAHCARIVALP